MRVLEAFHFLRPLCLLLLPAVLLLWWQWRQLNPASAPIEGFPAHLAAALTVGERPRGRLLPVDGFALALLLATLAVAGPSWRQQQAPWLEESAPIVVALEVSDSMRSNDLLPSRLERARLKLLELAARRPGGRTAVIAYAGSAHLALPPTQDQAVLKTFIEGLDPAMMPVPGSNLSNVLPLAAPLLAPYDGVGSLVIVTDGLTATDLSALSAFTRQAAPLPVIVYLLGSEDGGVALLPNGSVATDAAGKPLTTSVDRNAQRTHALAAGARLVTLQTDASDLSKLINHLESMPRPVAALEARWIDEGWWLLWPTALILLASFRRGWALQP